MIVQCEKCKTKFRIADERVAGGGVRVRCSRCAHVFHVHKGDDAGPDSGTLAQTKSELDRLLQESGLASERPLPSFPDRAPTQQMRPPTAPLLGGAVHPPIGPNDPEPITQMGQSPRATRLLVSPPPSQDVARALGFASPGNGGPEQVATEQARIPGAPTEPGRPPRVPSSLAREFAFDEDATAPAQAFLQRMGVDPTSRSSMEALAALGATPDLTASEDPRPSSDPLGRPRTGPDALGKQRTGPDALGKQRTGPDALGKQRTGPDALGKQRTGPDALSGRPKPEPPRPSGKAKDVDRFGPPPPPDDSADSGEVPLMGALDSLLAQQSIEPPGARDGLTTPLFPPPPSFDRTGTQSGLTPRSSPDLGDIPGLMSAGAVGDDPFAGLDLGTSTAYSGGELGSPPPADVLGAEPLQSEGAKPLARIDLGRAALPGAVQGGALPTTRIAASLLPQEPRPILSRSRLAAQWPTLLGLVLGVGVTGAAIMGPAGGQLSNLGPDDFLALVRPPISEQIREAGAVRIRSAHVTTYPTKAGPMLVVAGEAENTGGESLGSLLAVAHVLDGGRVLARGEAPIGVELDPATLSRLGSGEELTAAYARLSTAAPARLDPGQRLPFMVVFPSLPPGVERGSFRVEVARAPGATVVLSPGQGAE